MSTVSETPVSTLPRTPEGKVLSPRCLNHYATATLDMNVTHKFWTEIMGCKFTGAVRQFNDGLSELETGAFLHCFYTFQDGASIAFFELPKGYDKKDDGIPYWTKHLALTVDSHEELAEWQKHLTSRGVEYVGEVDHDGLYYSLYLTDPNGQFIELTHQTRPLNDEDIKEGYKVLAKWNVDKAAGLV
ncbi:Glyoxalase/Bleomycin resistance protein/Dihydroxybiphenyl dioxygenase [Penicillium sp. IBT 16267x]|nr:Glyoxalase/Bleomycin resistance protein/Dihydroxybiphenyl dioxygenase [Penicillium sp. IBT 16267x]